jgi:hypothetical protein
LVVGWFARGLGFDVGWCWAAEACFGGQVSLSLSLLISVLNFVFLFSCLNSNLKSV